MDTFEFISHLRDLDIVLSRNGERLRINAPNGALNPELREELVRRKKEILDFLAPARRIPRVSRKQAAPLSFAQERLWFLDQFEPNNPVYNICRANTIKGRLSTSKLQAALDQVLTRHESLRTTIKITQDGPKQKIAPELKSAISVVDLEELPLSRQEGVSRQLAATEARRPFDLMAGPLIRGTLLKPGDGSQILLIVTHHAVADGWSIGILFHELWLQYCTLIGIDAASLPELPIQYRDYSTWQRECLTDELLQPQLAFWKRHLSGELPILNLATDRPRPPHATFNGAREPVRIPGFLQNSLRMLSQEAGTTLFVTLMAALNTLLYRYSDQEDIIVGFPIANRNHTELEDLIGLFTNTLVLRTNLSGQPTFRQLLARVQSATIDVYAHQDLPFEKLIEELRLKRDSSRNALFQVMFILQNAPRPTTNVPGLTLTHTEIDSGTSKFDLTLALADTEDGLVGSLEYNTDLFDSTTVKRMIGHFQKLLESVAGDVEQQISTLPIMTDKELQLLNEWNNTDVDYPEDVLTHELFEMQVVQTPDAVALVFEENQLTYRDLNRRANQLAHHLGTLGVGPEVLAGIYVERSLEMVVGLLGVLKAGGAYVPLDPSFPDERIAYMIHDAGIAVLLSRDSGFAIRDSEENRSQAEDIPYPKSETRAQRPVIRHIDLDFDLTLIHQQTTSQPVTDISPTNLAYVIYTSGSTGNPKGVEVSHRALVNFLTSMQRNPGLTDRDVLLAVTTISFDIAALEIYLPLITGARVVLATMDDTADGPRLQRLLTKASATVLQATPSTWQMLVDAGWKGDDQLTILCGGEALPGPLAKELVLRGSAASNLFGPTETTVWSTICRLGQNERTISIGSPIANTRIDILDRHGQPIPVGVPGELHIGGDGLARGYLDAPESTAERFIPNIQAKHPGMRFYRTGDRTRYLESGKIEFLGRLDNQIKIRGHRIELQEIEAVLRRHPAVNDAVVMSRGDAANVEPSSNTITERSTARLIAYVVSLDQTLNTSDLYRFLKKTLPDYMIPSAFVVLDSFPLTVNGKVDRSSLLLPDGSRPELDKGLVLPRTPTEEILTNIWADVLNIDTVGIFDNFFELGGHSLVATRVIARVRDVFEVDIPLRVLFDDPMIAEFSHFVENAVRVGTTVGLPTILPTPRQGILPLSIGQEHMWQTDQLIGPNHFFNMPYAYRLDGPLQLPALKAGIRAVVRRHESLRTVFPEIGGTPVQLILDALDLSLPLIDLSQLHEPVRQHQARRIQRLERFLPFDVTRGPLVRARVIRLATNDHLLLITMHHLISDHWSMQVFVRDLITFYLHNCGEPAHPLPTLPIQFADYAQWERHAVNTEIMQQQLCFWRRQLDGSLDELILPRAGPGSRSLSSGSSRHPLELRHDHFAALKALGQKENVSTFMILLTLLKALIYRYSGQKDIRIGTLVANRRTTHSEDVIGHYVNTVIVRTALAAEMTFGELLKQVRERFLGALAHQDLPFEALVQSLEDQTNLYRKSLFQVLFVFYNTSLRPTSIPTGLHIRQQTGRWADSEVTVGSYDLLLVLREESTTVSGYLAYKDELYESELIDEMMACFKNLLRRAPQNPNEPLGKPLQNAP